MLEFSGGNRKEHLLGVFMRDQKFFFRSFGIRFHTSKNGKGCFVNFMGVSSIRRYFVC